MGNLYVVAALLAAWLFPLHAVHAESPGESYRPVPIPPEVRVEGTELDGPVFADAKGKTLYQWPLQLLRNGPAGDPVGISTCKDTRTEFSAGLMSPYPGGLRLPELDQRPSCTQMWPPFVADAHARPIGKWTTIKRKDGALQWAFDGLPLYTSYLDQSPGDVLGGRADKRHGDSPALRVPIGPASGCASRLRG